MQDLEPRPKRQPRENLHEVLIAGFDPTLEANRGKAQRRPNPIQVASSLFLGGGASFFVGVFAGVASGALLGYAGAYGFDLARRSLRMTLPGLMSAAQMAPSVYLLFALLGAAIGLYIGCVLIAPALDAKRTKNHRNHR